MNDISMDRLLISELIDENAEAILIIDSEYSIIAWNKRCEQMLSVSATQAIGQSLADIRPELVDADFISHTKRALLGKSSVADKKYTVYGGQKTKNGVPSFSRVSLPDAGEACMIILREVEVKEEQVSKFKPLIAESPIATAIYRPDGSPKYFNPAYSQLWGATAGMSEIVIQHYNIFNDEQLQELGIMPFIQRGFEGDATEIPPVAYSPYETASIRRLGLRQKKYVKGHVFPIRDEGGDVYEVVMVLSDITFQKQAEEILTDTHLKFQMLTMGLPGVIYEYEHLNETESNFRYISQGCNEMFGYSPEQIMNNAALLNDLIHPEDLDAFLSTSRDSSGKHIAWQWEGRIVVDGEEKWIEGKSSPTRQKDGSIVRYGLLLDITEKKEVEKQYKLSEERLQLALEGAELGLWEWDLKDRKTVFNKSWATKFGYDKHELELGYDEWGKFIHPDDFEGVEQRLKAHIKGRTEYFEAEYRFRTKSGGYRWILDKGRAVERDSRGRVLKASGTYLDINEKKTSELLIQRNERLFTQLFENSPLGLVLLDEQHKVIQMNQGFKNMFGYSEKEIIGNQLNNILVPVDSQQEAIDINMLTASGNVGMLESRRKHKNGSYVPVIIYGVPVTMDNRTIGIYGIYVDITARTNAENELQIRNSELDNFVYKVSHDLRAPLSSILGLVNLAQHQENDDDLSEYIGRIGNRVKQLDHFINDVLSHSKNLKLAVTVDEIDLRQIIDLCFEDLSYLPNANKIKLSTEIVGQSFLSDKWRVNEIFRNLISNAIKYLNPDISHPLIDIKIHVTDDDAHITFSDNGIGIQPDTLPKVFDMFYRATEHSEGSGIGLYIVKNAIEKLGGSIDVKSKPEVGTSFTILIPNSKDAYLVPQIEK